MSGDLDLLVLCELNPDVLVTDAHLEVTFGQVEQLVSDAEIVLGSSGAITAAAAAAQGLRVAVCAVVGADLGGELARRRLAELGVETEAIRIDPQRRTGMTVVLSRGDGDRSLLTFAGTMGDLTTADVPADLLVRARHVHVSSIHLQTGLQAGLPELLAQARAGGATTSVDPGWDPAENWTALVPVLPEIDYLFPNAAECRHLAAAVSGGTPPDLEAAAALSDCGPTVVVKDGADGALLVRAGALLRCPAGPVELVDTTGAGDNFDAGFLAGLLSGADPLTALARGVATGSYSVGGRGGTGRLASARTATDLAATLLDNIDNHCGEELA